MLDFPQWKNITKEQIRKFTELLIYNAIILLRNSNLVAKLKKKSWEASKICRLTNLFKKLD